MMRILNARYYGDWPNRLKSLLPEYPRTGYEVKHFVWPGIGRYALVIVCSSTPKPFAATFIRVPLLMDECSIAELGRRDIASWFSSDSGNEALSRIDPQLANALLNYTSIPGSLTMRGKMGLLLEYAIRLFVLAVLVGTCYFAYLSHVQLAAVQTQVTALDAANKALASEVATTKKSVTATELVVKTGSAIQAAEVTFLGALLQQLGTTSKAVTNLGATVGNLATKQAVTDALKASQDANVALQEMITKNHTAIHESEEQKRKALQEILNGLPKLVKDQLKTLEADVKELLKK